MNWTNERTFSTYEEAAELKNTLQHSTRGATLQLKIKRYQTSDGLEAYAVKSRQDPSLADAVREVEEKLNTKRQKKTKKD